MLTYALVALAILWLGVAVYHVAYSRGAVATIAASPEVRAAADWWAKELTRCREATRQKLLEPAVHASAPTAPTDAMSQFEQLLGKVFYPVVWCGEVAGNLLNKAIDFTGLDKTTGERPQFDEAAAFADELAVQIAQFKYQHGYYPVLALGVDGLTPVVQDARGEEDVPYVPESALSIALRNTGFTGRSPFLIYGSDFRYGIEMRMVPAQPMGYPRQSVSVEETPNGLGRLVVVRGPIG